MFKSEPLRVFVTVRTNRRDVPCWLLPSHDLQCISCLQSQSQAALQVGPSTSPCSAPRSFGISSTPSSNLQPLHACVGRRLLRSSLHSTASYVLPCPPQLLQSPFMALLTRIFARGSLLPCVLLPENYPNEFVHLSCFPQFSIPFLSQPGGISASNKRHRYRHKIAWDWCLSRAPSQLSAQARYDTWGDSNAEAVQSSPNNSASPSLAEMSRTGWRRAGLSPGGIGGGASNGSMTCRLHPVGFS